MNLLRQRGDKMPRSPANGGRNDNPQFSCCQVVAVVISFIMAGWLIATSVLYANCRNNKNTCFPCHTVQKAKWVNTSQKIPVRQTTLPTVDFGGKLIHLCCYDNFDGLEVTQPKGPVHEADEEAFTTPDPATPSRYPFPTGHGKTVPAAHLHLSDIQPGRFVTEKSTSFSLRGWAVVEHDEFLRGFGLRNGRLITKTPGLYFVYSQLQLVSPKQPAEKTYISHYVYKYNNRTLPGPGYKKVLSGTVTKCQSESSSWHHTSLTARLIRLGERDELEVRVSDPSAVQTGSTSNVFGIVYIGK